MGDEDFDIDAFLERLLSEQKGSTDSESVDTYLRLRKPIILDYRISSFLREGKYAMEDNEISAFRKKMELFDGIESTFGFDSRGEVEVLKNKKFWSVFCFNPW